MLNQLEKGDIDRGIHAFVGTQMQTLLRTWMQMSLSDALHPYSTVRASGPGCASVMMRGYGHP